MCKCTISNRSGAHQYEGERWQRIEFCSMHAAAPALLEALEAYVDDHDAEVQAAHRSPGILHSCRLCDKARAAIAQAKGEK